jgi:hypothetical protein
VLRGVTKRVVGRGLVAQQDVNSEGLLLGEGVIPGPYVQNGLLDRFAYLELELWNGSGMHEGWRYVANPSEIWVNGTKVDGIIVVYGTVAPRIKALRIRFPAGLLRFGQRNLGGDTEGPGPTPAVNEIRITTANPYNVSKECGDHDGFTHGIRLKRNGQNLELVEGAGVTFRALAPIVLVHGIESSTGWFQGNPGFDHEFHSRRAPVFYAPTYGARAYKNGLPSLGSGAIRGDPSNQLLNQIRLAAKEYGTERVHILAHSKGGLWSRTAIETLSEEDSEIGVFSLTTLNTPHRGSVLADFSVYSNGFTRRACRSSLTSLVPGAGIFSQPSLFDNSLCVAYRRYSQSHEDLRPTEVDKFNRGSHLPGQFNRKGRTNDVFYRVVGADANIDSNKNTDGFGIINSLTETHGWSINEKPLLPGLYRMMQQYRELRWDESSGNIFETVMHGPPYPLNDFAVTVPSQFFSADGIGETTDAKRFSPVGAPLGTMHSPMKRNHASIGGDDVGRMVLDSLTLSLQRFQKLGD